MSSLRVAIEELLAPADVRIDGARPWDVRVRDERFYARVLAEGSLGLGESYMDGWWDCERIDELAHRIFWHRVDEMAQPSRRMLLSALEGRLRNLQTRARAAASGGSPYQFGDPTTGFVYLFNSTGLFRIIDGNFNGVNLTYVGGDLVGVDDGRGRALSITYGANGRIDTVSDGTRTVSYGYSGNDLTSVTDLRGKGQVGGGQAAYGERDRQAFANALDRLLTRLSRSQ